MNPDTDMCSNGSIICNETMTTYLEYEPVHPVHPGIVFQIILMGIAAVIGFVGNVIIVALISLRSSLQTIPNLYILNRGIADIMISLIAPFGIMGYSRVTIRYTPIACKILNSISHTSIVMSAAFLVVMSIDCYLACRKHTEMFRFKMLKIISGISWCIGILLSVGVYHLTKYYYSDNGTLIWIESPLFDYQDPERSLFSIITFIFFPLVVIWIYISLMYPPQNVQRYDLSQKNKDIRLLLVALAVVFTVCQVPFWLAEIFSNFVLLPRWHLYITISLLDINIALNAIICVFWKKDLKSSVLFCSKYRRNQPMRMEPITNT